MFSAWRLLHTWSPQLPQALKQVMVVPPFPPQELVSDEDRRLHQSDAPFQELALQEDAGEALQEMKVQGSASCSGTLPCAWHSS